MKRPRGFLLVAAVLMSAALLFYAAAYVQLYRAERALSMQGERKIQAREAAAAAVNAAAVRLKADAAWNAGFSGVVLPHANTSYSLTFVSSPTQPWSTNNSTGSAAVIGWNGRTVPPGMIHLVGVGRSDTVTQLEEALISAASTPYGFAMFGTAGGSLGKNNVVDSYDSSTGTVYPTSGGRIGTNATNNGAIALNTGTVVNGDIRVGPGGTGAVISGAGKYQKLDSPTQPWSASPAAAPTKEGSQNVSVSGTVTLAPGRYHDISTAKNSTLILNAGTYVIHRLEMSDFSNIVVNSGPVNLYFTDHIRSGQQSQINVGGKPGDLNFFGTSGAGEFRLKTGAVGVATVYATSANIVMEQGSEMYGAFLGKKFQAADNVKMHFDTKLGTKVVGFSIATRW